MVTHININETVEDKKSWFNIKRFRIGDVHFEKPEKSLDVKNLDRPSFDALEETSNSAKPPKFSNPSKILIN